MQVIGANPSRAPSFACGPNARSRSVIPSGQAAAAPASPRALCTGGHTWGQDGGQSGGARKALGNTTLLVSTSLFRGFVCKGQILCCQFSASCLPLWRAKVTLKGSSVPVVGETCVLSAFRARERCMYRVYTELPSDWLLSTFM